MRILLLSLTIFAISGCSQLTGIKDSPLEVSAEVRSTTITTKKGIDLRKVNWTKYSDVVLFTLYLILLITACVYFKHTGKRLQAVEGPLSTMTPRLSPVAKILSLLAKVIGVIYCKKK